MIFDEVNEDNSTKKARDFLFEISGKHGDGRAVSMKTWGSSLGQLPSDSDMVISSLCTFHNFPINQLAIFTTYTACKENIAMEKKNTTIFFLWYLHVFTMKVADFSHGYVSLLSGSR